MFCPHCGQQVAPGSTFCNRCGKGLAPVTPQPGVESPRGAVAAQSRPRTVWPYLMGLGIAALLALMYFLRPSKVTTVATEPVAVMKAPVTKSAQIIARAEDPMPDDIRAYLKHLEHIEELKKGLVIKQMADMKVFEQMLGATGPGISEISPYDKSGEPGADPNQVTKGKFEDMKPQWEALLQEFQSVTPPAECKSIADDYYGGISEIPGMIGDLNNVLNQVNTDPSEALQKIQGMQNRSFNSIDKPFASADLKVQAICDKYHTPKWFNIGDAATGILRKL